MDASVHLALLEEVEAELAEVEQALSRLDDGSYGRCQTCDGPIGDATLAAVPVARHCAEHGAPPPGL